MNIIDIITLVCFALSIAWGFKSGVIRQLGSLAGLIVAIFLAKGFGSQVATLLHIGGKNPHIWGYIIVLILSLVGVALLSKGLSKFAKAVGLGVLDRVAGATLSAITCALVLSILFSIFNLANNALGMVKESTLKESKFYKPTISVSNYILPTITWVGEQLPGEEDK